MATWDITTTSTSIPSTLCTSSWAALFNGLVGYWPITALCPASNITISSGDTWTNAYSALVRYWGGTSNNNVLLSAIAPPTKYIQEIKMRWGI